MSDSSVGLDLTGSDEHQVGDGCSVELVVSDEGDVPGGRDS